jgi:Family of unknown function (DUF6502)
MTTRSAIILEAALGLLKPLARLMLRHGVAYPAFVQALKRVFVEAAQDELLKNHRPLTDSAVSLLSGVHRRDIRNMKRNEAPPASALPVPMSMSTQVVARWLSQPHCLDAEGNPLTLARTQPHGGFDALVTSVSSDIRPRAVLEELIRLGIAEETEQGLRLRDPGFAPRQGLAEMAALFQDNLHDHLAAASSNLDEEHNFLEQSIFVDQITAQSAQRLHAVSAKAWRQAFKTVMQAASERYEHDQGHAAPHERTHRVRFGSYFYAQEETPHADKTPAP